MKLHPLTFAPNYRRKLWGGARLRTLFGRELPRGERIGESWEVVDRPEAMSVVAGGPLAGRTLGELLRLARRALLGEDLFFRFPDRFPLLVKLIDADQTLSVQVHPPDEYARRWEEEPNGKAEAWFVLHAERGSRIYRGVLPGVPATELIEGLRRGEVNDVLFSFEAKAGDVVYIPPGTVHAAGPGVVFLEVQQNSDVTYRLHDWDRVDAGGQTRPLQVEKGLSVIDFRTMGQAKLRPARIRGAAGRRHLLVRAPCFTLERLGTKRPLRDTTDGRRFHLLTAVAGSATLRWDEPKPGRLALRAGVTVLVPACVGPYALEPEPELQVVRTTID